MISRAHGGCAASGARCARNAVLVGLALVGAHHLMLPPGGQHTAGMGLVGQEAVVAERQFISSTAGRPPLGQPPARAPRAVVQDGTSKLGASPHPTAKLQTTSPRSVEPIQLPESASSTTAQARLATLPAKQRSSHTNLRSRARDRHAPKSPDRLPQYLQPFEKYGMWRGELKAGMDPHHESLFLGVQTRCDFQNDCSQKGSREARDLKYGLPPLSDHTFEWHDLIGAMEQSKEQFNMLELGAGWAKWIVDAVGLARASGRQVRAIGVEAQPIHCDMAEKHIQSNKAAPQASMLCGAVGKKDGFVEFPVKRSAAMQHNYGFGIQHLLDGKKAEVEAGGGDVLRVPSYSLCTLVGNPAFLGRPVHFVSLDIQSFEYAVLEATAENMACLDEKVAVLHISMHRIEENDARPITEMMVGRLGWQLTRYIPLFTSKYETPFGKIDVVDGRLVFVNRRLAPHFEAPGLDHPRMIHRGTYTQHRRKKESVAKDWGPGDYITDIKYVQMH